MITFFCALALLIGGYFLYSRLSEKIFRADYNRLTPAIASPDGVDRIPLPVWKSTIIELLNIAGTGPIFGAISGALFGPIAFIWIVAGCILGGAVHDYMSGMISLRHNGESIVSLSKLYLNKAIMWIMRFFSLIIMVLVTACFVIAPSNLLQEVTIGYVPAWVWLILILAYYFLSTIFPIDKIIGRIYPIFGVLLMLMAVSVIGGVFFHMGNITHPLPELFGNFKDFSAANGGVPWWPFMMTTIACGAISGFHATQSPIMSKCVKNEKEGKKVFYGAMVLEGILALIWAAAAMSFYNVTNSPEDWQAASVAVQNPAKAVYDMCFQLLGPFGVFLAIAGVVICPITTGDTALRCGRLILAEWFNIDQKKYLKRIMLTIPLFGIVIGLSLWAFFDSSGFGILWSWFVWANQTFAVISLWISSSYLIKYGRWRFGSLLTALPATFMTGVVTCFLFADQKISFGQLYPKYSIMIGSIIAGVAMVTVLVIYLYKLFTAPPPIVQPLPKKEKNYEKRKIANIKN